MVQHVAKTLLMMLRLAAACTTKQAIKRPDGSRDFVIACGAAVGWSICYNRANQVCSIGYLTISQDAGFNRKELMISCPAKSAGLQATEIRQSRDDRYEAKHRVNMLAAEFVQIQYPGLNLSHVVKVWNTLLKERISRA